MRRIALVSGHASPLAVPGSVGSGGQNVYVAQVARHLAQPGYLVDVYTRFDSPSLPQVTDWELDVRVIHVPAGPPQPISKEAMLPCMDEFARFMIAFAREHDLRYDLARLKALAEQRDLSGQVYFAGQRPRSELRDYYSAADVFVTTPWHEPFGVTPLEAMACSVPVIGSAVGGIKHTVVDGRTGFLVPPNDRAAVADRLAMLHAQPQDARRMGREGLRRVHGRYTWRHVAARIADVYEAVLGAAPTSLPQSLVASGGSNHTELEWTN